MWDLLDPLGLGLVQSGRSVPLVWKCGSHAVRCDDIVSMRPKTGDGSYDLEVRFRHGGVEVLGFPDKESRDRNAEIIIGGMLGRPGETKPAPEPTPEASTADAFGGRAGA